MIELREGQIVKFELNRHDDSMPGVFCSDDEEELTWDGFYKTPPMAGGFIASALQEGEVIRAVKERARKKVAKLGRISNIVPIGIKGY